MFTGMDVEARIYLVLLVLVTLTMVCLLIGLIHAVVDGDRARASERAARRAAANAVGERNALRGVLAEIQRPQQPRRAVAQQNGHAVPADAPTIRMPAVSAGRHHEAT